MATLDSAVFVVDAWNGLKQESWLWRAALKADAVLSTPQAGRSKVIPVRCERCRTVTQRFLLLLGQKFL